MTEGAPDTIVRIHGLWMTPLAWEHWALSPRAGELELAKVQ
jgi:hypothetical protein